VIFLRLKLFKHLGDSKIAYFSDESIYGIALPEKFTFPFYYEPHLLTKIAATELQHYLESQTDLDHNFGLSTDQDGSAIGKMFGVLVVRDSAGKLGYLSAFSGKLAGSNDHPRFVPPVFDMLVENSFFLKEQKILNTINDQVRAINADEDYLHLTASIKDLSARSSREITALKQQLKNNKDNRKLLREQLKTSLNEQEFAVADAQLIDQSLADKRQLKRLQEQWDEVLTDTQTRLSQFEARIEGLKNERKERSFDLQQQLFDQYLFLNQYGQTKSVQEIFSQTPMGKPPSAAGECAIPKLLQFAFSNGYKPLAVAEFWWGASPRSDIRKHQHYYPACTGKCKPILAHMLEGIELEDNPLLLTPEKHSKIEIVYQDDSLFVVNKPAGLRSVPGVNIADSVYTRLKHMHDGQEPLMVHRLDMDTSGIIVVARTKEAHKYLQRQFLQRTLSKRYTAILSREIDQPEGIIDLPLCPDMLNRPRQLVSFTNGKKSITKYQVIARYDGKTKINFWPLTGRTHQLRMHAAHELGLNAPIIGDDLYGTAAERMYLHAASIEFIHPTTREKVSFEIADNF
jgi:tRNA pseudouridine32 synthase/23S rRNA pseudouridine746 synthase